MNEQLKIIISAEIDKLKKNVDEAKSKVSSFKDEVKKASENVDKDLAAAGTSISNGMKVGATALAGVATALLALGESTKEYRNEQAKLQTAFETAGASAEVAKGTYNDLYRVLGDTGQATEAASHLAQLTTNEKELSEWTNICQGVYATFGASLPIEGLTEAANETAKVGQVTGGLADALNWAGISEDAFNEKLAACNTEAEREKLIRETLNGIYSEAAANYEKNNADILAQNEAQEKLNSSMAALGEATAPIMTMLTSLAGDVLSALTPYVKDFADNYLPDIQEALKTVAEKLESALTFLLEHKAILGVMAGIIATVVTAIGLYNAVAAVKAAMDAAQVTTLGGLIAVHAAHAAAVMASLAPYIAIVAAIAAVIAIIVVCVKHWDEIKAKVIEVWNAMKEKIAEAKENIVNKITELKEGIQEKINSAKETVVNIFTNLKDNMTQKIQSAKDAVLGVFDKIKDGIKKKIESARDTVRDIIEKIKGFFNFEFKLPKLKTPKFAISPVGWKVGDLLQGVIPKLSIQWNARGGVFDKPTIFGYGNSLQGIGENGAEAVVPLENNLAWLDKLASMLNDRMGGGSPIVLQVDSKTFAEISVDSINQLTKQTGRLPLKIV